MICHEPVRYVEVGNGPRTVVLLHGLFGGPENWRYTMETLGDSYRFVALQFPIDMHVNRQHRDFRSIRQLTDHVERLFDELDLEEAVLCGNSLGGHVAIDFSLLHPARVSQLVLTGSAGLFERSLSGGKVPRVSRTMIRERTAEIFHDPVHITDELVDDVYEMLSNRGYVRFLIRIAKATRNFNMKEELGKLDLPTLVIWGRDDQITPPFVAQEFRDGIRNARLAFIDHCGHAPPIEQPEAFTQLLGEFLAEPASTYSPAGRMP